MGRSKYPQMGSCKSCFRYTMLTGGLCERRRREINHKPILFRRRTSGEVGDILGFKSKKGGLIPMRRGGRIVLLDDWVEITDRVARFYENITPVEIKKYNRNVVSLLKATPDPSLIGAIDGYVYLLRSDNEYYKIGRAKDIDARLSSIQRNFPIEIKLIHCFRSRDYIGAETYLHRRYHEYRMDRCEWFDLPGWAVDYIVETQDYGLDESLAMQL